MQFRINPCFEPFSKKPTLFLHIFAIKSQNCTSMGATILEHIGLTFLSKSSTIFPPYQPRLYKLSPHPWLSYGDTLTSREICKGLKSPDCFHHTLGVASLSFHLQWNPLSGPIEHPLSRPIEHPYLCRLLEDASKLCLLDMNQVFYPAFYFYDLKFLLDLGLNYSGCGDDESYPAVY